MKTRTSKQSETERLDGQLAEIQSRIRDEAPKLGFDTVGFSAATLPPETRERLNEFVETARHGDMGWIETRLDERAHPQSLWPAAKSVIMLGVNYGPETDPLTSLSKRSNASISVYAQNKDYHDIIKKRLKRLARLIVDMSGADVKVFVDTAPVMEKPLAGQAGVGWQGKHTNLVSREWGSWLFLGAIFTTLDLQPDDAEVDHCGSCQNCLDICPTNAFPAPFQLDARRCISYLTIEHKGPIPRELRAPMGNRIYGCDDCLAICPWNKFAKRTSEDAFHPRHDLTAPMLAELAELDDAQFRQKFSGSPIKRIGRDRFIRNVLIAIGNSKNAALTRFAEALLTDDSALVRGAAIWALAQLDKSAFETARARLVSAENEASVIEEWDAGPDH